MALADPIRHISTRPSLGPLYIEGLEANYRKAVYLDDFAKNVLVDSGRGIGGGGGDVADLTSGGGKYRIDLDISSVRFAYHHLFSEEHVLAYKLRDMYEHHKLSAEQRLVDILTAKIQALKDAHERFRAEVDAHVRAAAAERHLYVESTDTILSTSTSNNPSNGDETAALISPSDAHKLRAYKNEIKQAREQRDLEMRMRKTLTEKIVSVWRELKDLRKRQQFRNTDLKLVIRKREANRADEERAYESDMRDELRELMAERQDEYRAALADYNVKLKAWKLQRIKKSEAKKRQEERERKASVAVATPMASSSETPQQQQTLTGLTGNYSLLSKTLTEADKRTLAEDDLTKPTKPAEVDESQVLAALRERYALIRKAPADPHIMFELVEETGAVSPASQCSP